jgi:HlyD family secretion protein
MKPQPVRRAVSYAVAGVALIAALGWAFWPRAVPVDVATVVRGPMRVTVDEDGRTRIKERYVVSAPLAGRTLRTQLHPGDVVAAGRTVVAAIEPTDPALLDVRARAEAEARLNAATAARDQAVPRLERARTAHDYAAGDLRRVRRTFETRSGTGRELDAAEEKERAAQQELRAAEFALRIAEYERDLARAALEHTRPDGGARADAADSTPRADADPEKTRFEIRSPIEGRVLRVFQESSTVVAPGSRLLEVGDPADLEVEIDVLSRDAVRITPGAKVLLEDWGGNVPLTARVRVVEPAAFTKISSLGVEEQRVYVVADFVDAPDTRPTLGDAYRVEARVVVWESTDVLKVPSGALVREGDEWAVFAIVNGRAGLRRINLGHLNSTEAEVLGGLSEGDRVIAYPSDRVRDGLHVVERS